MPGRRGQPDEAQDVLTQKARTRGGHAEAAGSTQQRRPQLAIHRVGQAKEALRKADVPVVGPKRIRVAEEWGKPLKGHEAGKLGLDG